MKSSKIGLFLVFFAARDAWSSPPRRAPSAAATITIVNVNAPGVGFNDPTPVAPVGGNPGTTIGQQRLKAFRTRPPSGAEHSTATSRSLIQARVRPAHLHARLRACSARRGRSRSSSTRGGGGIRPFPGLEANTLYGTALANKRARLRRITGPPGTNADDIRARFNSNLGNAGLPHRHRLVLRLRRQRGHQHRPRDRASPRDRPRPRASSTFSNGSTGAHERRLPRHLRRSAHPRPHDRPALGRDDERAARGLRDQLAAGRAGTAPSVTAAEPGVLSQRPPLMHVSAPAAIAGPTRSERRPSDPARRRTASRDRRQALDDGDARHRATTPARR